MRSDDEVIFDTEDELDLSAIYSDTLYVGKVGLKDEKEKLDDVVDIDDAVFDNVVTDFDAETNVETVADTINDSDFGEEEVDDEDKDNTDVDIKEEEDEQEEEEEDDDDDDDDDDDEEEEEEEDEDKDKDEDEYEGDETKKVKRKKQITMLRDSNEDVSKGEM